MPNYTSTPGRNYNTRKHQMSGTAPTKPRVGLKRVTLSQALDTIPKFDGNLDMLLLFYRVREVYKEFLLRTIYFGTKERFATLNKVTRTAKYQRGFKMGRLV